MKFKKIFTHWKVILLLLFLVFALVAIKPSPWVEGVTIKSVAINSSAAQAGIENPTSQLSPLARERIISINGEKINSPADYYSKLTNLVENQTVYVVTNKQNYNFLSHTDNLGKIDLGIKVNEAPITNLRKGLDLAGGTRVLLKPTEKISASDLDILLETLKERLNVYGLADVVVRSSTDLSGDVYILIEMAGVTEDEVKELLAKQGKFEAKIGNETVFFGGKKDITYVCRSAECSGIDPSQGCYKISEGYACRFFFSITLSPEAAKRQGNLTSGLSVISETDGSYYLSQNLDLFLDDKQVDTLKIGSELKGKVTTDIQISGSGTGRTTEEASKVSLDNMKRLQAVIITGSLPVKLDVVKIDTISPVLGKEFLNNVLYVGLFVLIAVSGVVLIIYRKLKIVLPMVLILISEVVLVLGFAALVGWNLDLASIAGILIMVGTAVDHLIIITDETIKGEFVYDWKEKMKRAMIIVLTAYLTVCSGMIPLWFAGAGLLKGFAFTTIIGLSFGVLIARSAYAAIAEILLKE